MKQKILNSFKKILPESVFLFLRPGYHKSLAFLSALYYRFPSRHIKVIAVTGTKGKSSTVEFINGILETAGYRTAVIGTIRFKVGEESKPNLFKMTMPGRGFIQKTLREAVNQKCDFAVLEATSEGAKQFRNRFIETDTVVITNIAPEHIESHGSYENYLAAKIDIARGLERTKNKKTTIVVNSDDKENNKFLVVEAEEKIKYSFSELKEYKESSEGLSFQYKNKKITSSLRGRFNAYNMLAAAKATEAHNISIKEIAKGLSSVKILPGRALMIDEGQDFEVVVDYAHTPGSLEAIYETFTSGHSICVLGNAGGGRDRWKRPLMAQIAEEFCQEVILTDEDPYDEDPESILEEMRVGMKKKKPEIILDRREAIRVALKKAEQKLKEKQSDSSNKNPTCVNVLITGKGTDPYIMRSNGQKEPWSDEEVTRDELRKLKK